jgi:Leucine Rich repeat
VEGVRAFQPALYWNRTLSELNLSFCLLGDEGIHVLADALVGNTTMQTLDIGHNFVTSSGLDDITLLLESTRLQNFDMQGNHAAFHNLMLPCSALPVSYQGMSI